MASPGATSSVASRAALAGGATAAAGFPGQAFATQQHGYAAKDMNVYPHLVACEHCDSVYQRCTLAAGEVARCSRCEAVLQRANPLDVNRWLALTLTTAIVFLIANVCPVVRISLNGTHREATLWEFAWSLAQGSVAPLALVAALVLSLIHI